MDFLSCMLNKVVTWLISSSGTQITLSDDLILTLLLSSPQLGIPAILEPSIKDKITSCSCLIALFNPLYIQIISDQGAATATPLFSFCLLFSQELVQ